MAAPRAEGPSVAVYWSDGGELATLRPVAKEFEERGFAVELTDDFSHPADLGVYACQSNRFYDFELGRWDLPPNAFSAALLHDLGQANGSDDYFIIDSWHVFDLGFLPGPSWERLWERSVARGARPPRLGIRSAGWPKFDHVHADRPSFAVQCAELREDLEIGDDRTVVLLACSWSDRRQLCDALAGLDPARHRLVVKYPDFPPPPADSPWFDVLARARDELQQARRFATEAGVTVAPDDADIYQLVSIADVVLSNGSNVLYEGVLVGTPGVSIRDWTHPSGRDGERSSVPVMDVEGVLTGGVEALPELLGAATAPSFRALLDRGRAALVRSDSLGHAAALVVDDIVAALEQQGLDRAGSSDTPGEIGGPSGAIELPPDTSPDHTRPWPRRTDAVIRHVGGDKRVLVVETVDDSLVAGLTARSCRVTSVGEDVLCASQADGAAEGGGPGSVSEGDCRDTSFDVVVIDGLGRLGDPVKVLRRVRALMDTSGLLVVVARNVAHAAVRLDLLRGRWVATDEAEVRFYTRRSILHLLEDAGYTPLEVEGVIGDPVDADLLDLGDDVPDGMLELLRLDADASAREFVVSAAHDDADGRIRRILHAYTDLRAQVEQLSESLVAAEELSAAMRREAVEQHERLLVSEEERTSARQIAAQHSEHLRSREADLEQSRAEIECLQAELERRERSLQSRETESERLRREVERLAEQLGQSTSLLRREERSVVKPVLRRVYGGARSVGRSLPPATQQQIRARLSPIARRVAPGSAQADAYERAAALEAGTPPLLGAGPPAVERPRPTGPRLPPGRPGSFDVVVLPVIDWHFRIQRPQHLATELARLGHRVVYLTTEFDRLRPGGPAYSVVEQVGDQVWVVRLACPSPLPRIYRDPAAPYQAAATAEALKMIIDDLGLQRTVLLAQHPFWEPILWSSGQYFLAYDLMDDHAGFEGTEPWVIDAETRLVKGVDLVTTTAASLADKAPGSVVIRNAADVQRFARAASGPAGRGGRPTVGYFGAIAHWFDTALVEACARAHPEWDFVLIGSTVGAFVSGLRALPNVSLLGELPYEALPGHLEAWDVCLIPFHVIPLTEHTNPVKAYEYLSAGKPVVATDMPEVRLMRPHVHVARDREAFLAALDVAMSEVGDAALAKSRRAWAKEHTWTSRARAVETAVRSRVPRASVIVLCYNNLDFTRACLESLDEASTYLDLELVLVDNASTDGTADHLRSFAHGRDDVTLVLNGENLGFAGGNNAGLASASGDVLVLLNNDTVVTEGWLLGLVRHLRDDPSLGLVGPVTNNIGNEAKVDVQYGSMAELGASARAYTSQRHRQLMRVPTVAFFCVAMRRDVYMAVGGLDEDFGIGFFEDDDYCRRVKAAGYDVAIAEDVFVHHHLSASFDALGAARKQELFEQAKEVYERKWGPWTPHVYRADVRT